MTYKLFMNFHNKCLPSLLSDPNHFLFISLRICTENYIPIPRSRSKTHHKPHHITSHGNVVDDEWLDTKFPPFQQYNLAVKCNKDKLICVESREWNMRQEGERRRTLSALIRQIHLQFVGEDPYQVGILLIFFFILMRLLQSPIHHF